MNEATIYRDNDVFWPRHLGSGVVDLTNDSVLHVELIVDLTESVS